MDMAIGMAAIFGSDIGPIISLRVMEQEGGYLHAQKPMRVPTKENFRQDMCGLSGRMSSRREPFVCADRPRRRRALSPF